MQNLQLPFAIHTFYSHHYVLSTLLAKQKLHRIMTRHWICIALCTGIYAITSCVIALYEEEVKEIPFLKDTEWNTSCQDFLTCI